MAALVLGISYLEWGILVLAMTVVLTAEMFNQILKAIWNSIGHQLPDETNQTLRIGTAGVFVAILGAGVTVLLILVPAALRLFAH
jgi:diacylglycerol kinase